MAFMKTLKYLPLLLGGLLIGIIFLEILLRLFYWAGEQQIMGLKPMRTTITWQDNQVVGKVLLSSSIQGWFVTPSKEYFSYIEANKEGFYDTNHSIDKPTNTYRVLLLGDSFVASLQTSKDKTFGQQLENHLNSLGLPKRIEVISIGMGDTGTAQQYLALKEFGLKYHPDLVIQMFLTANDLKNNWPELQQDPYRPYFKLDENNQLAKLPFSLKSERQLQSLKEQIKNLRIIELLLAARQTWQEQKTNKSADYPVDYHVYDRQYNPQYQQAWQITQELLLATKTVSEQSGSKYLLTVLANNEQVNNEVWAKLQEVYPNLKTADLDLEQPDKILSQFCTEQQLSCNFMLPDFQSYFASNEHPQLHYRYDGHWNELGTKVAVTSLVEYLKEHSDNYFSIK